MYCKTCGAENSDGAKVCEKCGANLIEENHAKKGLDCVTYAGVIARVLAYIVDAIILGIVNYFIGLMLGKDSPYIIITIILELVYFAIMEGSKLQASLGKLLLKMKVTDENGERLSMLKAGARYLILSVFSISGDIVTLVQGKAPAVTPTNMSQALKSLTSLSSILALAGIVYTIIMLIFILSSQYGQGIHDRIVKSYVIDK